MQTDFARLFVLDTNVLMHDPAALFRFEEHDVFLPMVVLEELDAAKTGTSEVARNVRQVSRFLDQLLTDAGHEQIPQGLPLNQAGIGLEHAQSPHGLSGRLFFQTRNLQTDLPAELPGKQADNNLLSVTLCLQQQQPERQVLLVSKDINLRIKAAAVGIIAQDYRNDRVLEDADLLGTGVHALEADFWTQHSQTTPLKQSHGRDCYHLQGPELNNWHPNEFVHLPDDSLQAVIRQVTGHEGKIEQIRDYRHQQHGVWGITARNREQNYALNLLMDADVDFVTLLGNAGTGKTLLTLAAGLAQTLDANLYREIIVTRVTVSVGEDIGFLPGTEEEKMTPWMGALLDNLEVLHHNDEAGAWGQAATNDLLASKIKIRSLNFMRGRTFLNRFVIVDEAQNLTAKQMKTLITRIGPGSKMVCLGNIGQIDTPYLTETTSGLTYVVDKFRKWPHSGHITLRRGERSRLADYAAEVL